MRAVFAIILLASFAAAAPVTRWMPNPYGSATMAHRSEFADLPPGFLVKIPVPPGRHKAMSCTVWMRLQNYPGNGWITTQSHIIPEPVQHWNKDLAAGAWGWSQGVDLTAAGGSIALPDWEWQSYTNHPAVQQYWPRGIYTINAWSPSGFTLTLGGAEKYYAPGGHTNNVIPGEGAGAVISGSGVVKVGISLCPCHVAINFIDGVSEGSVLSAASILTDEWKFATFRWQITTNSVEGISTLGTVDDWQSVSVPRSSGVVIDAFDSGGEYRIGATGLHTLLEHDVEFFDLRTFPWHLSDPEIDRIHADGVIEITKRGFLEE